MVNCAPSSLARSLTHSAPAPALAPASEQVNTLAYDNISSYLLRYFQYSIAVGLIPVSTTFVLHQTSSSYNLLLIGRALAGFLYGVTLVTLILHIADNSSQFMRRHFMWTISAINLLPTVILAEFISTVTGFCDVNASIGVIMFALAILTLIFMPCTYESIVFLLANGTDLRALEIMLKLRNESRHYIRRDFNEFKMMLVEDYSDGGNIFSNGNSRPLFLVLLVRLLNVLLTSNCVYWIFLANIWFDFQYWNRHANRSTEMLEIVQNVFANQSSFNDTTLFNSNMDLYSKPSPSSPPPLPQGTIENIESFTNSSEFNATLHDSLAAVFNQTLNNLMVADQPMMNGQMVMDNGAKNATIINDSFIHSAYSYRLPVLPVTHFLAIVSIIKIVVGIPFLCYAETFQIYRNRIILKVALCIGGINLIFFMATLVCSLTDDSLIFTFYIAKLLSVIYSLYLLIAFSVDTIGYCELGESFSLTKRYGCIAFIVACEYLFYAIAILLIMNALFRFYFHVIQSMVICFICYVLLKCLPNECLNCTLRSARDKHFVKMANANNWTLHTNTGWMCCVYVFAKRNTTSIADFCFQFFDQ